ncbi:hypothetical protein E2562_020324 [Oryza meyeriana var. granulata]|uniref:Uncharacterized protein n=1 Tax=Oryza meyeriana var. granulata TaxID=110450 RepID=A0A6G1EBR0_9ORYZ|nr:hypothetical protein E2562_020324 [Oryza meyeriana var. granulata]
MWVCKPRKPPDHPKVKSYGFCKMMTTVWDCTMGLRCTPGRWPANDEELPFISKYLGGLVLSLLDMRRKKISIGQ